MRAACGAIKQADTKILFKASDGARNGRCLGIRGNRSLRKAASLNRWHEHTQRAQIVHFGASVSPLRRNVEHWPDQLVPAIFGISARFSLDFDRYSNICLRVSQQSFPAAEWDRVKAAARNERPSGPGRCSRFLQPYPPVFAMERPRGGIARNHHALFLSA